MLNTTTFALNSVRGVLLQEFFSMKGGVHRNSWVCAVRSEHVKFHLRLQEKSEPKAYRKVLLSNAQFC